MSLRVSVVSESEFTVQGHGVHTAYVELTNALRNIPDVTVSVNTVGPADITHLHTVGLYALRRVLFDKNKKVVSAHVVPASFVGSLVGARLWLPLARLYLRWFYNRADMLFAVSDSTKRELIELGVKRPIEIVYNLVDTTQYATTPDDKRAARDALGIPSEAWVVVGAGQVQPRKRVDEFVKAAQMMPDTKFVWVGGMPFGRLAAEHGPMQEMINSAPDNFVCTGVIDHAAVRQYYQAADVFWLPSEQETFGLVVVEAAAASLPVVLRDIADYAETFANHAVCYGDEGPDEVLRRLRDDSSFYKQAVESSSAIARRFDAAANAQRVLELYRRLVG